MIFYKVHYTDGSGESNGYRYFTNKIDADKSQSEWISTQDKQIDHQNMLYQGDSTTELSKIQVSPTKKAILNLLQTHANHPNNG